MTFFESVFVIRLGFLNTIRILLSADLRRARFIHCKWAGTAARFCFRHKLRRIVDQDLSPMRGSNSVDYRAITTIKLAAEVFGREPDRYRRRFLQQALGWSVYDPIGIIHDHELIIGAAERSCVLVPVNPFMDSLKKLYQTGTRQIRWSFGTRRIRKLMAHCALWGYTAFQAAWNALTQPAPDRGRPPIPAVSVLNFRGGLGMNQRTDLFWLSSETRDYPVILEYASTAYPISPQYQSDLRTRGIRIVETHRRRKRISQSEEWRPGRIFLRHSTGSIIQFCRAAYEAAKARSAFGLWTAAQGLIFELERNRRFDYYETYNIRAEFISGFTTVESAHSSALRELGGVTCAAQYTVAIDPWESHTSTSTFNLNFGESVKTWGVPFLADYTIFNGYLFKTALATGTGAARQLRQQLANVGVRRIVCFLDEGLREYEKIDHMTLEFWRFLLRKLTTESDFGVVFKPKKNTTVPVLRSALGKPLDAALDSRRLIILDRSHYPGLAGLAADVTVGILSTGSLEVAVMGGRVVYLNPWGYVPEFLREIQSNIYDSAEEAIAAVEELIDGTGHSNLGLHPESFLQTIDTPRDAEVSQRIEFLLSFCLNQAREGTPPESTARKAAEELSRRWPVTSITGPSVH